jgi:ferritin-like metal-binding protein YciE
MAKEPKKLDALFHDTLKDIYFAEKKILSTLPKMAKAAQSAELKAGLDAMLRAINIVQPALEKFYGALTDEQKERFNRLAPVQG